MFSNIVHLFSGEVKKEGLLRQPLGGFLCNLREIENNGEKKLGLAFVEKSTFLMILKMHFANAFKMSLLVDKLNSENFIKPINFKSSILD